MKQVLFVAPAFPPSGWVGSLINTKILKYLPQNGWEPIVLTMDERYFRTDVQDRSLFDELPADLTVLRATGLRLPRTLHHGLRSSLSAGSEGPTASQARPARGRLQRALRWAGSHVANPDRHVAWVPAAVRRGLQAIRRGDVDLICASAHPNSALLVGYHLKRLTGKPLVLEIGDYWTLARTAPWDSWWQRRVQQRQERRVLALADHVILRMQATLYERAHPDLGVKLDVLPHGYDPEDFEQPATPPSGGFVMAYVGKLVGDLYPIEPFLEAVRNAALPGFHLNIVGTVDANVIQVIARLGLEDSVTMTGFLGHREAIRKMLGAHALLLIVNDIRESHPTVFFTKLPEYLAARRPILALVPASGAAAAVVSGTRSGWVCRPREAAEIEAALKALYAARATWTAPPPEKIREYDYRTLVARRAAIFTEVADRYARQR